MTTLDEVKNLKSQGMTEEQIVESLEQRGVTKKEIYNALSQSQIKQAVSYDNDYQQNDYESSSPQYSQQPPTSMTEELGSSDMQPSLLSQSPQQQEYIQSPEPAFSLQQPYSQTQDYSYPQNQYPEYQSYSPSLSPDTITEIAEQALSERLTPFKEQLNSLTETKNTLSIKIEHVAERLERIEKIIDRLQLSILQKVGDYITNVDEIKKEIIETQKSFKTLTEKHHKRK